MIGASQPAGSRIVDYLDAMPAPKIVSRWRVSRWRVSRSEQSEDGCTQRDYTLLWR